ncbi:phosphodiesterase [Paenalcaligenes faecalis]|uniref:phosphodiesterase n=1 Tax=Paenalcaligenes faecalis TaxID=2980099 RepID=UPI0022B94BDC|nr:phosphodiesterase [Paenalcaligenes faecalis]
MKILHFSDLHIVPAGQRLFGLNPAQQLQQLIDHALQHHGDADLCVITGDLTHKGEVGAYEVLAEKLQQLPMPVQLLVGNHDDRHHFRSYFPDQSVDSHGFVQRIVDTDLYTLVFLDTLSVGSPEGELCAQRLQWLSQAIATSHKPILLFSHHPIMDLQFPSMDWIKLREHEEVMALIKQDNKVAYMFAGHVHRPAAGIWHGVPFATVSGASHQHHLHFTQTGASDSSLEPAGYGVISVLAHSITVHFQLAQNYARFAYQGPPLRLRAKT